MDRGHFEVVHTGPRKFHARFVANNGEIVWWTESYSVIRNAQYAIRLLIEGVREAPSGPPWPVNYPVVDQRPTT